MVVHICFIGDLIDAAKSTERFLSQNELASSAPACHVGAPFSSKWHSETFFLGGSMSKPEYPEKALRAGREPTTNSTHIWQQAGY